MTVHMPGLRRCTTRLALGCRCRYRGYPIEWDSVLCNGLHVHRFAAPFGALREGVVHEVASQTQHQ